jgi:hypothetical protein
VSNGVELLSNGLRAFRKLALMGFLAFPLYIKGKDGVHEREEKKKEKN